MAPKLPIRRRKPIAQYQPVIVVTVTGSNPWAAQSPRPTPVRERSAVLVERVLEALGGLERVRLGFQGPVDEPTVRTARPLKTWIEEGERGPGYAARRIQYFIKQIQGGSPLEPIELAGYASSSGDSLQLLQGYHRLVASAFVGERSIEALYQGPTPVLAWLRGEPSASQGGVHRAGMSRPSD